MPKINIAAYCKKIKLDVAENGIAKRTLRNIVKVLNTDPQLKEKIHLNLLDGRIHIDTDMPWTIPLSRIDADNTVCFSEYDASQLCVYIDEHMGWCNEKSLDTACKAVATDNAYDSRIEYFNSLKWDGVLRLETLFVDYLGAEDSEYTRYLTKLIFVGGVARTYKPGTKFDIVPVLTQGIGKSLLTSKMSIRPDWYANDIASIERNSHEKVLGKLIVDLSELSAMSRDPERLKDFVSSTEDVMRKAYGRYVESYLRRCIFIASTDKDKYLNDLAGDRRWFPVKCSKNKTKDASTLTNDEVAQLCAEAKYYYDSGMSLEFPASLIPEVEKLRKEYSEIEDDVEQIKNYIISTGCDRICAEEILEKCLHMSITPANIRRVNSILKNKLKLEPATLDFGEYGRHKRGFRI